MLVAEVFVHPVKFRIKNDLLKAANDLVEIVIVFVCATRVDHFKVLFALFFTFDANVGSCRVQISFKQD